MSGATGELKRMRRTMREVFGLERLRPGQAEVIRSVISGADTLAVMPTGAGKSLCYQLPALHLSGTTVICDNCLHPAEERLGLARPEPAAPASAADGGGSKQKKVIELNEGDAVRLPKYGRGLVAALEGDKVSVRFPDGETRTFKREFARRA